MTQDEIQAVARALAGPRGDDMTCAGYPVWRFYRLDAQAAIAALDAARSKAGPVAWMYRAGPYLRKYGPDLPPVVRLAFDRWSIGVQKNWTETPLYAHPPAPDAARGDPVARLIAYMKTIEPDEETAGCPATWADFIQILEGIAEAGEPFNG